MWEYLQRGLQKTRPAVSRHPFVDVLASHQIVLPA
jgi:hypothetical protein